MTVRKCCWCGKFLENGGALEDGLLRGGVCESCLDLFEKDFAQNEEREGTIQQDAPRIDNRPPFPS